MYVKLGVICCRRESERVTGKDCVGAGGEGRGGKRPGSEREGHVGHLWCHM